ncbi:carbonate dehydratase [Polychytrium aggregatum]|uniref:carbonate dehydratase n=1 Tax=Polychytrium aggregatum TaxID=110093 RepID=UPI0022FE3BCA|nr:carbonate dehydratase [Polychytrium aggregatum]KAI9204332.1 carbonate dehydratase [Polychytrium aggregatum]
MVELCNTAQNTEAYSAALDHLLAKNKEWASKKASESEGFFESHADSQSPEILWIGCSDSRVPPTDIVNLSVGDVFVHRNIANVVVSSDLNLLSVLQYAVEYLKVKHIIVCGHYNCGGVKASMSDKQYGLIDNWLCHIKDVHRFNKEKLDSTADETARFNALVELNAIRSVQNICHTATVQNAWARGQELSVHGWCFNLHNGLIKDLGVCVNNNSHIDPIFKFTSSK